MSGAESGQRSMAVNDNGAEVGDVGEGRAGPEQIADSIEKPRGIVVGEKGGGIEADRPRARERRRIDEGPGRIVRSPAAAVGPVSVGGECGDAGSFAEMEG